MKKKIFKGMLLISAVTLIVSAVVITLVQYGIFAKDLEKELAAEAEFVGAGVEAMGKDYLEGIDVAADRRITWIDGSGTVIFDTAADTGGMEYHGDREEFLEALDKGVGQAERKSETMSRRAVYYAKLLEDGTVIRVSSVRGTPEGAALNVVMPVTVVLVCVLVLAIVLSSAISNRITRPLNLIDLNNPVLDRGYEELEPLAMRINRQNKMIESQLEDMSRQRQEFKTITENMVEGFLVIDNKMELLTYNRAALCLLGAPEPGENVNVLTLNRKEEFISAVEEALNGRHVIKNMDHNGICCQIIANPVYNGEGLSGAVIVIIDVTEKERLDSMRREFTSNVSHELRTPLTSIFGMSELLMSGTVSDRDVPDFAKSIHDETGRMIQLVNDILRLSQLDENKSSYQTEQVDLNALGRVVAERLKLTAADRNIEISVEGEPVEINGVYTILEELVYNLCDNAIKYNVDGGKVTIETGTYGGRPFLSVEDTGIGIPKEHLNRVFERFYRVDKSHSKKIGGTGLGLSIVKHAAAFHGARVTVQSTVGRGTKMTVTF